jgi:hypothetical protein
MLNRLPIFPYTFLGTNATNRDMRQLCCSSYPVRCCVHIGFNNVMTYMQDAQARSGAGDKVDKFIVSYLCRQ